MNPFRPLSELQACQRYCWQVARIVSPIALAGLLWLLFKHN